MSNFQRKSVTQYLNDPLELRTNIESISVAASSAWVSLCRQGWSTDSIMTVESRIITIRLHLNT